MNKCIRDAYDYYHNPLSKDCEREFSSLPILFGRSKKEAELRKKYEKKGLKIKRYEDIKFSSGPGGVKDCATFLGNGRYRCELDNSIIADFSGSNRSKCEECFSCSLDCRKLIDYLFSEE